MSLARAAEKRQRELVAGGEAHFMMPYRGHEGVAALALFLGSQDWLHVHYRDQALLLARGLSLSRVFDSLLANALDPAQGGMMGGFHADAALHILPMVVPTGNHALQAVGVAQQLRSDAAGGSGAGLEQGATSATSTGSPLVACGFGDGTSQQGEVLEAIAEAVRDRLPLLFYCSDNGYAISTETGGRTFFDLPSGPADTFLGCPIHRFDARDIGPELDRLGKVVEAARTAQGPTLVVLRCERLTNHTNADDQRTYRAAESLEASDRDHDPVANLRRQLAEEVGGADLDAIDQASEAAVEEAAEAARRGPEPQTVAEVSRPFPARLQPGASHPEARPGDVLMIEAMRRVLDARLASDDRVVLLGEDIADPKGDVFGVTRGLSSTHGRHRVINTALTESTITGTAIGRAMAGGRPVGFIQFADFLPNGINQVLSELGTIRWRSGGAFECPVILMVTCGGYKPGLGPFHAQTFEALLAGVPGVDVFMPSTAADAAGLLNAAFEGGRPTVFLYPKACLNDRGNATGGLDGEGDVRDLRVSPGTAARRRTGKDLTLVAWGSTVSVAEAAADTLAQAGHGVDLLDLRTITPWDLDAVVASAATTGRLLVVHEDNLTAGFGAEVVAAVSEAVQTPLRVKRVARPDVPVPQAFRAQLDVLPSYRRVLDAAASLLGIEADWSAAKRVVPVATGGEIVVEAEGSSPADAAVTVTQWLVAAGDRVSKGQNIADLEADKAVFELAAPADAEVAEVLVAEGEEVPVGTPILRLRRLEGAQEGEAADDGGAGGPVKRLVREDRTPPVLSSRGKAATEPAANRSDRAAVHVYLSPIHTVEGRNRLDNSDLERRFPDRSAADIVKRTGIESRPIVGPDQNALSMALEAAGAALAAEGLALDDLTGIVCHTTTPPLNTPSMACMVLNGLDERRRAANSSLAPAEAVVYDVNAACSGWLYALDAAFNTVRDDPRSAVLVITTEALSRVVDPGDFDTAILFGDAATATVVRGYSAPEGGRVGASGTLPPAGSLRLIKPVLSGKADPGLVLTVGFEGCGHVQMDGKRVFVEGVRAMTEMAQRAFTAAGKPLEDVDWLVPHQANRRIFDAVAKKLNVPEAKVIDQIAHCGNTSSSSIPLAIARALRDGSVTFEPGQTVGAVAFGGGFTFGAAILEVV